MFLLFLLLAILFVLLYAHTPEVLKCEEELEKMRLCAMLHPVHLGNLQNFDDIPPNRKSLRNLELCIGSSQQCEVSRSNLKQFQLKFVLIEKTMEISSCLNNDLFQSLRKLCSAPCSSPKHGECMAKKLLESPHCTEEDIEEFKKMQKDYMSFCRAREVYEYEKKRHNQGMVRATGNGSKGFFLE